MFRKSVPFIAMVAMALGGAAGARAAAGDDPDAPWETVMGEGYAMAMPRAWTNLDKFSPQVLLYRQADGTGGVSDKDEFDQKLQAQLILESIQMEPDLEASANVVVNRILGEGQTEQLAKPTGEKMKLADGTDAFLITIEIRRQDIRMLIIKLLAKNGPDKGYVATGTITASKDSNLPAGKGKLGTWLKEMVKSFVKDPEKFDRAKVKKAYQERDKK